MEKTNSQIATRVSVISIVFNVLLSAFKIFAGVVAHSQAMISDALHSLSDVLSTVVVIIGVRLSNEEADRDHPYGHERLECVAAVILAALLLATGLGIGYSGAVKLFTGAYTEAPMPGALGLTAALVSIVVKEAMFWYTIAHAKKINSGALKADAWHHRSDALSSVASFIGIFGARRGYPFLDPATCVLISVMIAVAAVKIFIDASQKMVDRACGEETVSQIREAVLKQDGVITVDELNTRLFGDKIYVDVEISFDALATLRAAHDASQRVHDAIELQFPDVKHCMVHVNPWEGTGPEAESAGQTTLAR